MEQTTIDLSDEEMVIKREGGLEDDLDDSCYASRRLSEVCSENRDSSNSPLGDDVDDDNIVMIRMDIKEPLCTIKTILEEKFGNISEYKFTLQDSEELDDQTNLLDHCVQGEGLVQINLELKDDNRGKRLDIIDVLKPDEDDEDYYPDDEENYESHVINVQQETSIDKSHFLNDVPISVTSEKRVSEKKVKRKANDERGKELSSSNAAKKACSGLERIDDFASKIPIGEVILSVNKKPKPKKKKPAAKVVDRKVKKPATVKSVKPKTQPNNIRNMKASATSQSLHIGHPSTSSIQLWQFLLELLTNHDHRKSIQWLDREGEFELIDPEKVAKLWGMKRNKPQMNYEKLSRALRFYYDGDMLSKVPGKKFVYKFICDLKFLIGYTAKELNEFVVEAEALAQHNSIHYLSEYPKSPPSSPETVIQQGVVLPSNYVAI